MCRDLIRSPGLYLPLQGGVNRVPVGPTLFRRGPHPDPGRPRNHLPSWVCGLADRVRRRDWVEDGRERSGSQPKSERRRPRYQGRRTKDERREPLFFRPWSFVLTTYFLGRILSRSLTTASTS